MIRKEVLLVSAFFLSVMLFSTYLGILTKEAIMKGELEPLFPSPDDYRNVIVIFSLIIIGTLTVILFIKIKITLVKVFENLASFILTTTTFSYFLPPLFSILLALILVIISELKRSYFLKNLLIFLSISSASALMGSSLSYHVVLVLFLVLSVYDIVSVFVTKHMVYMAEKLLDKPSSFVSVFPSEKIRKVEFKDKKRKIRVVALGAGDYFLPSILAVSLIEFGINKALVISAINTLTILLLFHFISKKDFTKPLPALPFLFVASLLGTFIVFYL